MKIDIRKTNCCNCKFATIKITMSVPNWIGVNSIVHKCTNDDSNVDKYNYCHDYRFGEPKEI